MDSPSQIPLSNFSRFFFQEQHRFYYAYGNTPAQDFLEYASFDLENKEPSVLFLGCGDIRSCFYTIWKNFDPGFKQHFKGVHFVLNDRSAAVLARNIIFLYLCLKTPENEIERKKWLFALWSIWFCHELLPYHKSVLQSALKTLLKFSVSERQWSSSKNPLHSLVHYFSLATMLEIRDIWTMWFNGDVKIESVKNMKASRLKEVKNRMINGMDRESFVGTVDLCGAVGMDLCKDSVQTMVKEYKSYLTSGSVHVECLMENADQAQILAEETSVNLTLYERKDGKYTLHYGSCPFRCFQHTFVSSVEKMKKAGMHVTSDMESTFVNSKTFAQNPLLANSFQQFSISMISAATVLQNQLANISFMLNCQDVFELCQAWEIEQNNKQFDLIFATNVIDSVAPPAFVLATIRLLKDTGYFLSSTMIFKAVAPTAERYLETVFGFHPKLLPVICGIRCINHEGDGYTSTVSHNHAAIDSGDVDNTLSSMHEKVLIWKRVKMEPLLAESVTSNTDVTTALCSSFLTSCTSLLTDLDGISSRVMNCLCTATSIQLLVTFSARIRSTSTEFSASNDHLKQLCSSMRSQTHLKPFFASIQTQSMLNGVHLHLTVDKSACPTCTKLPLSSYLGLFCVEVGMMLASDVTPAYLILLHDGPYLPLQNFELHLHAVQKLLQYSQVFDCLAGVTEGRTLKLYFHAPLSFLKDKLRYKLAVIQYTSITVYKYNKAVHVNAPCVILQDEFCLKHRVDLPLNLPEAHNPQPLTEHSSTLGTLIKHCGNGDAFESTLTLALDDLPDLLTSKLQVKMISLTEVEVQCLDRSLRIMYPYPIAFDKLSIQRSKKAKSLYIKAVREAYRYEEKGQLFHINPDDHFSLPPIMVSEEKLQQLLMFQFRLKERKFLIPDFYEMASPLFCIKKWIMYFLNDTEEFFIQLILPGERIVGLVEVINRVIDVKRRVPAIDLRYCFLDTLPKTTSDLISEELLRLSYNGGYEVAQLIIKTQECYDLLKKIFNSFSLHTVQSAASDHIFLSRFSPVKECKIEKYFTRAVVYPLYPDPDRHVQELSNGKKCSYCDNKFDPQDLLNCSRCNTTSYCCKQCQRNHWSEHKLKCKSSKPVVGQQETFSTSASINDTRSTSRMSSTKQGQSKYTDSTNGILNGLDNSCSCCNLQVQTKQLKKCMGCKTTSYCSKQCQINHWSEHKLHCKRVQQESTTPTSTQQTLLHKTPPSFTTEQEQSTHDHPAEQPKPAEHPESLTPHKKTCSYCRKQRASLKSCSKCHTASYCGTDCQRAHWKEHKNDCRSSH